MHLALTLPSRIAMERQRNSNLVYGIVMHFRYSSTSELLYEAIIILGCSKAEIRKITSQILESGF